MNDVSLQTYELKGLLKAGSFHAVDCESVFYIPEAIFDVLRRSSRLETRQQFFALIHSHYWIKDFFEDHLGWSYDDLKKAVEEVETAYPQYAVQNFEPKQYTFGALVPKDFKPKE